MEQTRLSPIYAILFQLLASNCLAQVVYNPGIADIESANAEQIALGQKLFFDRRLSNNGTLSCAMCHIPEQGFAQNDLSTPVGIEGRSVKRNSPTLLNVAYRKVLFFDGREFSLENQIWSPLLSQREMANLSIGIVLNRLQQLDDYETTFRRVFNSKITVTNIGAALAAYERTLLAADSPFDRWHFNGISQAVDNEVKAGYQLFVDHGCVNCHNIGADSAQFTDDSFHNTGIGYDRSMNRPVRGIHTIELAGTIAIQTTEAFEGESLNDLGRYEVTGVPADKWKYRTPTLRNIALTAPYMHDGSIANLRDVVLFYMRGGIQNKNLDERILPFAASETEITALVKFMQSLSSPQVQKLIESARHTQIGDY